MNTCEVNTTGSVLGFKFLLLRFLSLLWPIHLRNPALTECEGDDAHRHAGGGDKTAAGFGFL